MTERDKAREALASVIFDQIGTNITVHPHGTPKAFVATEKIADAILASDAWKHMCDLEESHRIAGEAVRRSREPRPVRYEEWREALRLLGDVVVRAVPDGEDEHGFVAGYVQGTGSIHAAIPFLERHGITVRPGHDFREADAPGAVPFDTTGEQQ
jgi:hypothetical protein